MPKCMVSAAYYMRLFKYEIGKTLAFRVADEGKNMVFKGEVVRRERLKSPIGELDTVVIKPVSRWAVFLSRWAIY